MAERKRLRSVKSNTAPPPPDLRVAVQSAIDGMAAQLTDAESGLKALALRAAHEIEEAAARAEEYAAILREAAGDKSIYQRLKALEAMCDVTKTVGWLGPQLQGYLRDLGGTPAARKALKTDKPVGGRLADIRRQAGQHDS